MGASPSEAIERTAAAAVGPGWRWWWRALALGVMASVVAVLAWGAFAQQPRYNPFSTPRFSTWFWHRLPHPGYAEMPVRPVGDQHGFVPRELCMERRCAGLEIADDGAVRLRFDPLGTTAELVLARVRHTASGHLFAVSAAGAVWHLGEGDGAAPAWRQTELAELVTSGGAPEAIVAFTGNDGAVSSAVFDPAGERVLTASVDGSARLWTPARATCSPFSAIRVRSYPPSSIPQARPS